MSNINILGRPTGLKVLLVEIIGTKISEVETHRVDNHVAKVQKIEIWSHTSEKRNEVERLKIDQ